MATKRAGGSQKVVRHTDKCMRQYTCNTLVYQFTLFAGGTPRTVIMNRGYLRQVGFNMREQTGAEFVADLFRAMEVGIKANRECLKDLFSMMKQNPVCFRWSAVGHQNIHAANKQKKPSLKGNGFKSYRKPDIKRCFLQWQVPLEWLRQQVLFLLHF